MIVYLCKVYQVSTNAYIKCLKSADCLQFKLNYSFYFVCTFMKIDKIYQHNRCL